MSSRKNKQQGILSAAARLFWQKGYERTTIEDITSTLGINKAMLYYYFADKQRVLYDIITSSMRSMLTKSRAISRLKISPKEKMALLIQNHLDIFADEKAIPYVAQSEMRNLSPKLRRRCLADRDKYEDIFRSVIEDGIDAGQFRDMDVNLACLFILAMVNSVAVWYKSDGRLAMKEIGDCLTDFLYSGIEAP